MKHNLLKSVIISVILLMGVSNAWGYNEYNKQYLYFDGSSFTSFFNDGCTPYISPKWSYNGTDGNSNGGDKEMTQIGSTNYYYLDLSQSSGSYKNFRGFYIGRSSSFYDGANMGVVDGSVNNCIKATGWGAYSWSHYAPPMSSVTLANNGTTILGGSGTSSKPYLIKPGTTIKVKASGTKTVPDPDATIYYDFKQSSTSKQQGTGTTYSFTASSTANTSYTINLDGFTKISSTSSRTKPATALYFKTIATYAVTISTDGNGTVSPSSDQQVGEAPVSITATANTGYKFKNWTTTGGVVIANANNATTTITATAMGTVKANFEEDLTSTWHIVGTPTSIFKGTSTWAAHNDNMLKKTTGASTASKGSLIIDVKTLPANNDSYQFKVLNTNGTKWYGWSNSENYWVNRTNNTTNVYNADNNNLYFIPDALGDYKFDVDWSSFNPSLKVTFPTAYTVTFDKGTGGSSVTAKYSNTSFSSGKKVQSGKTVTFTQTASAGYTFKEWNTKLDGTGTKLSTNATYTHTVAATNTVYAIYTKKPDKTIYLEPTGNWNANKAVFQAHVWQSSNIGNSRDIDMTDIGDPSYANNDGKSLHRYYKVEVPAEYDRIVFYREDPANKTTIWNQTADLTIPTDNKTLYVITNNTPSPAEGVWKAANLVYTITLGYCEFGTYGIKYNGQSYFSKPDEEVTIDVPAGAQIEILEGQPHSNAYTGEVLKAKPTKVEIGQTLTINGDIMLDDNFKTKTSHVVYLGVPDGLTDWTSGTYGNFLWSWNTMSSFSLIASTRNFKIGNTTYYEYTLPDGRHSLCFQRKTAVNDNGTPQKESVYLSFQIPLNKVNCFTLKNEKDGAGRYKGTWDILPAQEGDYRLLYVEQKVRKSDVPENEWKTVIDRTYNHPSDIVKPYTTQGTYTDTVSLHVRRMKNGDTNHNPEVILQRYDGSNWVDIEAHMVNGPLKADAGMAMINGRRNAGTNAECDDFVYDDGIEVIKNDQEEGRVWNFTIQQFKSPTTDNDTATLLLDEENLKPYEGNYYIRTNNTKGGWSNYMQPDNYMTFSSYAKANSGYSHYYCKYVDIADNNTIGTHKNVKFIIANDYGTAISKEKADDDYTTNDGTLPANANVRWSWNETTNEVKRAYIKGSTEQDFLTVTKDNETPTKFRDNGNWIYEADITAKVNEKITAITAPYNNQNQSLLEEKYKTEGMPMLTGDGKNTHGYNVRVQYDFKINKTVALLIPGGPEIASAIDVLIERVDQLDATQVSVPITASDTENGYTVYAAMSFTQDHIEGTGTQSEKLYYWVSFPFDVRISDVFGFGEYGVHWIMEYYDGAERAEKGCWADSPTYWRYITDTTSVDIPDDNKNLNCGILKANQGYVLALALNIANMGIFTNTDKVSLYFPSMEPIKEINENIIETTVTLDEYECTIERDDRYIHDSNWHIIGVPSFSHKQQTLTQGDLLYFYTRDQKDDKYIATSAIDQEVEVTFKSLHSYMVQYAGTINWATTWTLSQPQGLAAKRNVDEEKTHSLRLELSQNGTYNDQTLVTLQEEGATEAFDMNLDLSKMMNAGNNIYTLAGEELIQVAGNALPIANTTIPVGVQIAKAGEYTFAMPDGTAGITVELIDYETNTTTNLLLSEYNVSLPAGTFENRFALIVKPNKVATDMETIDDETNGVKKYIIDGKLFLQKDGMLYDAQGHIVR